MQRIVRRRIKVRLLRDYCRRRFFDDVEARGADSVEHFPSRRVQLLQCESVQLAALALQPDAQCESAQLAALALHGKLS